MQSKVEKEKTNKRGDKISRKDRARVGHSVYED